MKGKKNFTTSEIQIIKKLISEKVKATSDKQRGIRAKIRKLQFYYSDFSSNKDGYTIADFEALIQSCQIKISDGLINIMDAKTKINIKPQSLVSEIQEAEKPKVTNVNLHRFKKNRFDPHIDKDSIIADSRGNYIICLKKNSKLPAVSITPRLTTFEGLSVIYTGIAGSSLRSRDFKQHFKGNNAGRSTLRKSLGVLFGYEQENKKKPCKRA